MVGKTNAKGAGGTIHKYTFKSASGLVGTQTVSFNITSIPNYASLVASQQMSAGFNHITVYGESGYGNSNVNSISYNSETGIASVSITSTELEYQVTLNVFVNE